MASNSRASGDLGGARSASTGRACATARLPSGLGMSIPAAPGGLGATLKLALRLDTGCRQQAKPGCANDLYDLLRTERCGQRFAWARQARSFMRRGIPMADVIVRGGSGLQATVEARGHTLRVDEP